MCNAMFNYNNEGPHLGPTESVSSEIQLEAYLAISRTGKKAIHETTSDRRRMAVISWVVTSAYSKTCTGYRNMHDTTINKVNHTRSS